MTQPEINVELVAAARTGARALRLKGGDPMVFGRANEEITALRSAGFTPLIIPGITAISAATSALGISLTTREIAHSVTFVTGHGIDSDLPGQDWAALVQQRGTLAFYMGTRHARQIAGRLIEVGFDPATPAVAANDVARQGQRIGVGRLANLAHSPAEAGLATSCVYPDWRSAGRS